MFPEKPPTVPQILLLGWQGTLRPAGGHVHIAEDERAFKAFRPWLDEALYSLNSSCERSCLRWGGSLLPLQDLLAPLLHRLMGIAAAAHWSTGGACEQLCVQPGVPLLSGGSARYADLVVRQWVVGTCLFLERLQADADRLAHWEGKPQLSTIRALRSTSSDLHDAGGPVLCIDFSDGSSIFYKPRPVTGELFWYQLTSLTGSEEPACQVRAARVLPGRGKDDSGFGWMEGLRAAASSNPERYWQSAGSLLCHAWLTNLTDLHMGNLLATADGPAVVDAEFLCSPPNVSGRNIDPLTQLADELSATGLLGATMIGNAVHDLSGFFGTSSELDSICLPAWEFLEDGSAMLSFKPALLLEQTGRPGEHQPIVLLPQLTQGFLTAVSALTTVAEQLLGKEGWVARVAAAHAPRILLRDTLDYGFWLSQHLLSNRKSSTETTLRASHNTNSSLQLTTAELIAIYAQEKLDIEHLYIPRFFVSAAGGNLATSRGIVLADLDLPRSIHGIQQKLELLRSSDFRTNLASALLCHTLESRSRQISSLTRDCGTIGPMAM